MCTLAMTALFCPNINSYKRAVTGVWSPVNVSWGVENRTTAVRAIPGNSTTATRLECRLPGADANPYLVMAACLAAGLHGIEKGLEAPVAVEGNAEKALFAHFGDEASHVLDPHMLDHVERAAGGFGKHRAFLGRMALGGDHRIGIERDG